MREVGVAVACAVLLTMAARAQNQTRPETPDAGAIGQIKEEAQRSEAKTIAAMLTDVYGPRLTGSPNLRASADYVVQQLKRWGIDAKPELWGPFGPGWVNDRFVALAVSPLSFPLIAYPKAWTPGTDGDARGDAVVARVDRDADFDKYRGKLRGKFVLTPPPQADDSEFARRRMEFFVGESVVALLEPSPGRIGAVVAGDGRVATKFSAGMYPWPETVAPQVVLAREHYNWIERTLEQGVPVVLEMNIASTYFPMEPNSFNVIAEIRGSEQPDQVVMIGAHLDSMHVGTGALDNAAGCAIVLDAMRILQARRFKMRRTVRLALWTGSEQGLQGSRGYISQHFVQEQLRQFPSTRTALTAYFDVDDGTGPFRGIYVQGNDAVAPIFEAWMAPFSAAGMGKASLESRAGKDHIPFDAAGLNGFHFMQDDADRDDELQRSNFDVFDRLNTDALAQNAAIVAAFAYNAATRPEPLPRKAAAR